ncbi:HAD hydrolase family protein [Sodalis-like endosymbiont of Proechinophthirus fluctus]|uniref:HAD hydrolase family protein n=1 Tax=Sodalis-like endosymbiont of Proechinophthirus fluctus TaxID=1462730 RepID=UPI00082F7016|nr:HAD hydrolase family protein [Sodalis-like endosymbiont of Proechinophthirus fluctus]
MRGKGVYVALATGRPYIGIERYFTELDLQAEGNFCITNNDMLVQRTVDGSCILQTVFDTNDYRYLEDLFQQLEVNFHALDFDTLYTANCDISRYTVYEARPY